MKRCAINLEKTEFPKIIVWKLMNGFNKIVITVKIGRES